MLISKHETLMSIYFRRIEISLLNADFSFWRKRKKNITVLSKSVVDFRSRSTHATDQDSILLHRDKYKFFLQIMHQLRLKYNFVTKNLHEIHVQMKQQKKKKFQIKYTKPIAVHVSLNKSETNKDKITMTVRK